MHWGGCRRNNTTRAGRRELKLQIRRRTRISTKTTLSSKLKDTGTRNQPTKGP